MTMNIPWIHTFHAVEKNRLKYMTKEEAAYSNVANWIEYTTKYADGFIAVSDCLKEEISKIYHNKRLEKDILKLTKLL